MDRVLIVDDHPQHLGALRTLFEERGWEVEEARHGAEALVLGRRTIPDLVITTLLMPTMDGFTLLGHWRTDRRLARVPFVVRADTVAELADERLCLELGADAFIPASADEATLFTRIDALRTRREPRTGLVTPGGTKAQEDLMRAYNASLVRELRQKALQLEQANSELAVREARLRAIVENEPECLKLLAEDGSLLEMNPAGLRMLEADSFEQVANQTVLTLIVPGHRAAFRELTARVFAGESGDLQFDIVGLKGTPLRLETHASPLRDATGRITALLGVTRDVTARHEAEERLRLSEAQFRAISENSPVGIFLSDLEGQVTYSNPADQRMTGLSGDDATGLNWVRAVHPDDRGWVLEEWKAAHTEGRPFRGTGRFVHDNGEVVWWDITTAPILDGGRIVGHVGLEVDVTERMRALSQVREAQARLQFAVSTGKVAFWDLDLHRDSARYSKEWKRQLGYEDHEITDSPGEWLSRVHPDDAERVQRLSKAFLAGAAPGYEAEFRLRHKDGSYRHILARTSEVRGPDGNRTGLVGSNIDITERAQLEAQLLQAQKMESVGLLAGGVAHDFNNLLTVIGGFTDLALSDLAANDPMRENLQEIAQAARRAAALTRQLLAFSRRQILQPVVLDLNIVIGEMENMLRRLIGEDVELVVSLAPDLGAVMADAGQMEQVLMNLTVNAQDAMPGGGRLSITTRNVELQASDTADLPSVKPGPYVMVTVRDDGTGMDAATRARIFEPFFTTKELGRGTGLGLSTVYGIVKQSGGSIWVESAPGEGTTFTLYFPIERQPVAPARRTGPTATVRGAETILVVEDEDALRRVVTRALGSAGYTVHAASSGAEALEILERLGAKVDLMLTDMVMPGMSGATLATRVAALYPSVRVLLTSGYADEATADRDVLNVGIPFIGKPFRTDDLSRKIREVLDA